MPENFFLIKIRHAMSKMFPWWYLFWQLSVTLVVIASNYLNFQRVYPWIQVNLSAINYHPSSPLILEVVYFVMFDGDQS
jgi:hypothetical protein